MATQSSTRKPKDTLEKPMPDSSIPYTDFKTLENSWEQQINHNKMHVKLYKITRKH